MSNTPFGDSLVGKTVGHYTISDKLGAGAMGVVYRARDTKLGRQVALKFLPPQWSHDETVKQRFIREAQAASATDHPNICTVHGIESTDDDQLFIVMSYYDGQTLKKRLQAGPLEVGEALSIALQVAEGLAKAHAQGIVHRDIKPGNLMLTEHGVRILDFGLAKLADSMELTIAGSVLGTISYMSPEQTRGEEADARSDVWAVGVVLYEMLTGQPPFGGGYPDATVYSIRNDTPRSSRDRNAAVPEEVDALIVRALQKNPDERIQSARILARDLRQVQGLPVPHDLLTQPVAVARRSMVVLPFVNLIPGEGDYFADGLTDEIITDLSRVRALRVISRTSSIRLKGAAESITEIASKLGVRYVLEGSVRQSGTSLRVMTTLIDVASDSSIWGQKYSGTTDDVFAIQERIARAIVDALRITLTPDEERRLADRPITDLRAYEWYLRARQELQRFTKDGLDRALEYLDRSTEIAGENVLLLAAQGETYWQYVNAGISSDPAYLDKAEECARRILQIDPASPHGHRVAGLARVHRGDAQGALRQLKQALDFDPNDPNSLYWGCLLAAFSAKHVLAEAWASRLLELDPVTPLYQTVPSRMAFMRGDYERALALLTPHQSAIRDHAGLRIAHGHLLAATGRVDDAKHVLEELARNLPDNPFGQLAAVYGHALKGDRAQVMAGLTPTLVEVLRSDPLYCWFIAQCHALVSDVDGAIRWIEVAVARGFINHDLLARDPGLARLLHDPRYVALIAESERQAQSLRI